MVRSIDTNSDHIISEKEWREWKSSQDAKLKDKSRVPAAGEDGTPSYLKFGDLANGIARAHRFALSGGNHDPASIKAQQAADSLKGGLDKLIEDIKRAEARNASRERVEEMKRELGAKMAHAENLFKKAGERYDLGEYRKMAGTENAMRAQVVGEHGGGAKRTMSAKGNGKATLFTPPAGWQAQTTGNRFNSSAFVQAMVVDEGLVQLGDQVNQNVNRGKELMMLFFYFAKMAESGDMGAMYQFMKFITFIISKDKSKQQIEMGKKLIELQDLSRQWTDKLLQLQTNANDPNASNELMKTMTIVKSETDSIATSQKLISQMMEEFVQVVETLTNTTAAVFKGWKTTSSTISNMGR